MTVKLHWFLPTAGDSRTVVPFGEGGHSRPPTIDYLAQIAQAADRLGYEGVLTPTGTWCEDAWLVTAALLRETERLKFLVAFRPNSITPTLAAQKAATYQRLSGGRLLLNIVTGGEDTEQRRFGDWLDHDARYDRTDEFLTVLRGALSGTPLDFEGEHFHVAGATVNNAPRPQPELYFGGASSAAEVVAAKHVDVYLAWGEPPEMVAPRLDRMRKLAAEYGRQLRFGIRLHVISRDTADEAWAETDKFLAALDPSLIKQAQQSLAKSSAVGQQRMLSLHQGGLNADDPESLVVAPNLWAGIGLVRGGAGTALVGSHTEVADRIQEYHELGFDEFIMSGHPHLEEAYWFAEGVFPILRARGLLDAPDLSGNVYSRFAPTAAR
ncbi:MAG TPA: LLM class flavin-dependent oxidoreductase [Ilumatobacter sp.]|nr:LLM class flavin-dependent oxidoreductase [Ilumatobacter sp.]